MPIVNCVLPRKLLDRVNINTDVVSAWSQASQVSSQDMTVNFIANDLQQGQAYAAMAWLYLPSLWSSSNVTKLQTTLACVLADALDLSTDQVIVITTLVATGHVIEDGHEIHWQSSTESVPPS